MQAKLFAQISHIHFTMSKYKNKKSWVQFISYLTHIHPLKISLYFEHVICVFEYTLKTSFCLDSHILTTHPSYVLQMKNKVSVFRIPYAAFAQMIYPYKKAEVAL